LHNPYLQTFAINVIFFLITNSKSFYLQTVKV